MSGYVEHTDRPHTSLFWNASFSFPIIYSLIVIHWLPCCGLMFRHHESGWVKDVPNPQAQDVADVPKTYI